MIEHKTIIALNTNDNIVKVNVPKLVRRFSTVITIIKVKVKNKTNMFKTDVILNMRFIFLPPFLDLSISLILYECINKMYNTV